MLFDAVRTAKRLYQAQSRENFAHKSLSLFHYFFTALPRPAHPGSCAHQRSLSSQSVDFHLLLCELSELCVTFQNDTKSLITSQA
jgi:hypothetical protein